MSVRTRQQASILPALDRRRFIAAALALTAGALTCRQPLAGTPTGGSGADTSALLGTLGEPAAAGRIGAAYLATHPDEAHPDRLAQQLSRALGMHTGTPPASSEALIRALDDLVAAEYCVAPLVRADGWLLAPSEARLYALAALAHGAVAPSNAT